MKYSKEFDKKWQEIWKKENLYKYNPNFYHQMALPIIQ